MEVKVRNLSEVIVKKIDEQAKEKGLSRNEFLKVELEKILSKEETEKEERYQELVNELAKNLKEYGEVVKKFMEEFIIDPEDAYLFDKGVDETSEQDEVPEQDFGKRNISIRYVPEDVCIRIKELAEKRGISKNEFMNRYLKQLTYLSNAEKMIDTKYESLVNKTLETLEETNRSLDRFYE